MFKMTWFRKKKPLDQLLAEADQILQGEVEQADAAPGQHIKKCEDCRWYVRSQRYAWQINCSAPQQPGYEDKVGAGMDFPTYGYVRQHLCHGNWWELKLRAPIFYKVKR